MEDSICSFAPSFSVWQVVSQRHHAPKEAADVARVLAQPPGHNEEFADDRILRNAQQW